MEAHGTATQDLFKQEKHKSKLVPLGAFVTAAILVAGVTTFRRGGDARTSQLWMRARVVSQLATVAVMVGTAYEWKKSS